jgi:hypothetical protein
LLAPIQIAGRRERWVAFHGGSEGKVEQRPAGIGVAEEVAGGRAEVHVVVGIYQRGGPHPVAGGGEGLGGAVVPSDDGPCADPDGVDVPVVVAEVSQTVGVLWTTSPSCPGSRPALLAST